MKKDLYRPYLNARSSPSKPRYRPSIGTALVYLALITVSLAWWTVVYLIIRWLLGF
jgi:hypothetical protein